MYIETHQPSVSDESKPYSGRIYDYLPGDHHYFDVGKQAAKQILEFASFAPKLARLIRCLLGIGIRKVIYSAIEIDWCKSNSYK